MKRYKLIVPVFIAMAMILAGCLEYDLLGEFDADASMIPAAREDAPKGPETLFASYDDYCDMVVLSWMPTIRTSTYDLYKNGELLAGDLSDTSYTDMSALAVDTEYWVVSKNEYGDSDSAFTIGRMADTPPTPANFVATDGEFADKVALTWDPADYAKYYEVTRDGIVLEDSVIGTTYVDSDNAPETATEYTVKAISFCGESGTVATTGYSDPLVAFRVPFIEDFEGFTPGVIDDGALLNGFRPRFNYNDAPNPKGTIEVQTDNSKYLDLIGTADNKSVQLILPEFDSLLVGESYTISFDIKSNQNVGLHIGTDETGEGLMGKFVDNYFLPTVENTNNGNAFGVEMVGTGEWKSYSFDFPQTGTGIRAADADSNPVPADWTLRTIQEGEQKPIIQFQVYLWGGGPSFALDNFKIELLD